MNAQRGLFLAAVFTEVTGVVLVIGSLIPDALDPLVSLVFAEPVVMDAPARLGLGIAGALMVGWAATIALLVRSIDDLSPRLLGTATAVGVMSWFLLDGMVSVANGAALNVAGNTVFLVILLVPALKLRSVNEVRQHA
ncbi:MAG: hypothetical protein U5K38_18730 [Woeseiaceae bacterium]|nr:hypothetical protein [Woeseiaceae bacterium]